MKHTRSRDACRFDNLAGVAVGLSGVVMGTACSALAGIPAEPAAFPPASQTVLRIARSPDGVTFEDRGEVFLRHAAAPDIVVLPNGHLLALFDYAGLEGQRESTIPAVARSRDGGRSWSRAEAIRFKGASLAALAPRHGELVRDSKGWLRLFFVGNANGKKAGHKAAANGPPAILSAVSRDGLHYHIDPRVRIKLHSRADVYPVVGRIGTRLHLFAAGTNGGDKTSAGVVQHFVSKDGRRFARLRSAQTPGVRFVGSIVSTGKGLRAYVTGASGILSLISVDGRAWASEDGVRLSYGWDPAVARLPDDSYLMIYCATLSDEAPASSQLVEDTFENSNVTQRDLINEVDLVEDMTATTALTDAQLTEGTKDLDVSTASETDAAAGATRGRVDDSRDAKRVGHAVTGLEDWDPVATDGFAPLPNFRSKVDYLEWYRSYALGNPEDNAYDHYARFMPGRDDEPGSKPEWPSQFNDMFSPDHSDPPGPWDPADYPDWEESNRAIQDLLDQFREAGKHEGYASPPDLMGDTKTWPDGGDLLIGMLLPSLSPHRRMVKSTLGDAWRMEDGRVSSEKMLAAWRTSLRGAAHMFDGATLIEDLVGTAETALVQSHARWALKHDVFSKDELQTAFDTLREYDKGHWDPAKTLRGEHAMAMQMTQWMFSPPTVDGQPKLNMKRAEALSNEDWFDTQSSERFAEMGPDDAYATIEALDSYYHELADQMRVGYPDVRVDDIEATTQKYVHTTPVTETFIPSLSRVYTLKTRLETSRRATQLSYATHLFKAHNGRWPESLDELPAEYGETIRIDPFSGRYFGYRVTEEGPTIYSASENGVDDSGIHSPRWGDEITNDAGSDDHVFWPPQLRR